MVLQYDPKQVGATIGGKSAYGFSDGTFINIERNEQAWNLKVGVDGEGTRAKNNNKSGKITITLMQSSSFNDYLSSLATLDEQSSTGAVPFYLRDASGRTIITALTCWIQKVPNNEFAKETMTREWVLESDEINFVNIGGN